MTMKYWLNLLDICHLPCDKKQWLNKKVWKLSLHISVYTVVVKSLYKPCRGKIKSWKKIIK